MGKKAESAFKHAKEDKLFNAEFGGIEGNNIPEVPDAIDKGVIAGCYLGWIIGKYGVEEGMRIWDSF